MDICNGGEINNETATLLLGISLFTVFSLISLPFVIIYRVYYKPKLKKHKMLQAQYNDDVSTVENNIKHYLTEGIVISQEVWGLPTGDTDAELFFELLKKTAENFAKPVFYIANDGNSQIAEQRMLKFVNAGLLAKTNTLDKNCWIVKLKNIDEKLDSSDRTVDLRDLMRRLTNSYKELILTKS